MTDPLPSGTGPPALDWARWEAILHQFSAATGLAVSMFDRAGERQVGPLVQSRLAQEFHDRGLWSAGAAGARLEYELAMRCMASRQLESDTYCIELQLCAMPLVVFGEVRGAVVIGWVFGSFPTVFVAERLAVELGIPAARLWRDIRLEAPVGPVRMTVFCDLLQTLVDSNAHQTEAIETLESLSHMRDLFLAQVSHDLRTPLTAIALRIEALLAGDLSDTRSVRSTLERMRSSVADESRMIEDLIDTARTRTGHLNLHRSLTRLTPIVLKAVAEVSPQAEQKQIAIRLDLPTGDDEAPIRADENRVQQVFWNLLSNAVKFSPHGGAITVQITLGVDEHEIRVRDDGDGIPEELLATLFQAFTKREQDNRHGLGLGLSIAKHIVELHGGSIQARSAGPDTGAEFVVRLPVAR